MAIDRSSSSSSSSAPSQEFFKLINSYLNNENPTNLWLILSKIGIDQEMAADEIDLEIFRAKIATFSKKDPNELKQKELILLAVTYQFGCGVAIDLKKARLLLNLANTRPTISPAGEAFTLLAMMSHGTANIDDLLTSKAMFELCVAIEMGPLETTLSHDKNGLDTVYHLEQAIKLGDSKACVLLAILYMQGKGVKRDVFAAHNLAMEGFSRGDFQAEDLIKAIKNLASTVVTMTMPIISLGLQKPEGIARALRRAIELGCDRKEAYEELKKLSEKKNRC
jgi:TPR repeat protein